MSKYQYNLDLKSEMGKVYSKPDLISGARVGTAQIKWAFRPSHEIKWI